MEGRLSWSRGVEIEAVCTPFIRRWLEVWSKVGASGRVASPVSSTVLGTGMERWGLRVESGLAFPPPPSWVYVRLSQCPTFSAPQSVSGFTVAVKFPVAVDIWAYQPSVAKLLVSGQGVVPLTTARLPPAPRDWLGLEDRAPPGLLAPRAPKLPQLAGA